ncbi:hypothetical protein HDU93_005836 [Gonapodya sp. JEL0774]|nr:hypothetical protein HDU93_005836 [Gonapodya sp. JEL0774]
MQIPDEYLTSLVDKYLSEDADALSAKLVGRRIARKNKVLVDLEDDKMIVQV